MSLPWLKPPPVRRGGWLSRGHSTMPAASSMVCVSLTPQPTPRRPRHATASLPSASRHSHATAYRLQRCGCLQKRPHSRRGEVRNWRSTSPPPTLAQHTTACGHQGVSIHGSDRRRHGQHNPRAAAAAAGGDPPAPKQEEAKARIAAVLGVLLLSGTANRVLYRMALVPLRDHVFFLAQCQNILYIVVYFSLLGLRYRQGKVTPAMLSLPKGLFVLTGACEAVAQLMLMISAANLPGLLLPLVAQTSLLWNLLFSAVAFKSRPSISQLSGVALVLAGVVLASQPPAATATAAAAAAAISPMYVGLAVLSFAFPAAATVLKEGIFKQAQRQLGGQQLDVLVVNSFCSAAQGFWVLLLLPLMTSIKGIPMDQLLVYLREGAGHLLGTASPAGVTPLVTLVPLTYLVVNILFNISALYLVRSVGAVATGLWMTLLVPVQLLAFGQPLPLLQPVQLGPWFSVGTALLLAGLLLYNRRAWVAAVQGMAKPPEQQTAS